MMDKAIVRWADGTHDTSRKCAICETETCIKPVHNEAYKIRGMDRWEVDLTAEELDLTGLTTGYSNNWPRADAIDAVITQENHAPEELTDDGN